MFDPLINLKVMTLRFLIIAASISFSASGQSSVYHPFPDSNAAWCCQWDGHTSPDCYRNWTTYQFNGYAQIGIYTYSRLEAHSFTIHYVENQNFFCVEQDTAVSSDSVYIRQDNFLKTVWMYDSASFSDRVLYNFNLAVGDTLDTTKAYWANGFGGTKIITSVDSILMNGNYRKRFNYNTGCTMNFDTDTSMIEGIGSLHGLMFPPSCFEFSFHLNEMTQDNAILFGDTTGDACHDFASGINEIKTDNTFTISPNPFHDFAILEGSKAHENSQLLIYNSFGDEVRQQEIISKFTIIQRDGLGDGIYFYRVVDSNRNLATGKFIIE